MKQIDTLNNVQQAFDAESFREKGHQLVDLLADYISKAQKGDLEAVYPYHHPDILFERWQKNLHTDNQQDLISFFKEVMDANIHTLHPNYIGHQVATPLPVNALADFMGSLMNSGMGVYEMGSPMVALERVVIMEVIKAMGYSESADGVLTSGGSLGNLTALLCARSVKAGRDVWQDGYAEDENLALMVSEQSHYCVNRAVKIMGWGESGIIKVPTLENYQLDASALEECYQSALKEGKKVIAIVANACSTATGSYDPIDEIADFCEKYDLWLHVDGAHGAGVIFSDKYRHLVKGIERADSMILDFHKMLSTTALATALVFKKGQDAYRTFAQKASYLWENSEKQEWFNLGKRTLECTKHAMSLRVYSIMKTHGNQIFAEHLDYLYDLGQEFYELLLDQSDFEALQKPESNIVCFRYSPQGLSKDQLNQVNADLRKVIIQEGAFYIVQTQLEDHLYLRVTLMNPFTQITHLQKLLEAIRIQYTKMQKA